MPTRQPTPEVGQDWCGHLGGYEVLALVCGRRGHSDRLVACLECGRGYLASELAVQTANWDTIHRRGGVPATGITTDHPAHQGAGPAQEVRSMNVPVSPAGNQEARQPARSQDRGTENLGEGHIMGNLTTDPELRFTPTGRAVTRLRVAYTPRIHLTTTDRWADGPTEYYDIDVWGQQGERCAELLLRGDRVVATGAWTKHTWEDRDGNQRDSYSLTARDIGPSLLFCGAQIDRTKRADGQAGNGS